MKNASSEIRTLYKTLLTGLTYNGKSIPVYSNYVYQVNAPMYYIEITNVIEENVENDSKFIREVTTEIEVVTTQYKYEDISVSETISGYVYNALIPNIGGNMPSSANFDFGHIYLENARQLFEVDEKGNYITRKLLTFRQLVTIK